MTGSPPQLSDATPAAVPQRSYDEVVQLLIALQASGAAPDARSLPALRPDRQPADELDLFDRHETRATETPLRAVLYERRSKDRRRDQRHTVVLGLVVLVVALAVYVAGIVVLSQALPTLPPFGAARLMATGYTVLAGAAVSGTAIRAAHRAMQRRSARNAARR